MSQHRRRDPRVLKIMRNRLHPLHSQYVDTSTIKQFGPSGLLRKFPHKVGTMTASGRRRINRLGGPTPSFSMQQSLDALVNLPLHQVKQPEFYILVVLDCVAGRLTEHDKDCLGFAQMLANRKGQTGAVLAVIFGESKDTDLTLCGIDRLLHITDDAVQGYQPELCCEYLSQIVAQFNPKHIIFPDSIFAGADLGRRIAAKLTLSVATSAWKLVDDELTCRASKGLSDIKSPLTDVILLLEQAYEPTSEYRYETLSLDIPKIATYKSSLQDDGLVEVDPSQIPLAEAGFIIAGGNGITDWPLFHRTAELLGATEGASRVAVDDGFMARDRQVGATGTWVSAQVYIAVGISGAIQHLQGISRCEKVIAINIDDSCDMIKRADLSVVGDSQAILAELNQLCLQTKKVVDDVA